MHFDVLLHWMTHRGTGAWSSFREGVERLVGGDEDIAKMSRDLCRAMSCLGYANFFIDRSARWAVNGSALVQMPATPSALLIGARTPSLVDRLRNDLATYGRRLHVEEAFPVGLVTALAPPHICAAVAATIGIAHLSPGPRVLLASALPMELVLQRAVAEPAPINWEATSFDLGTQRWVPGALPHAAREYRPRHGRSRYFVHVRRNEVKPLSRRESIYCSALIKGHALLRYDVERRELTCPARAPLPYDYARIACLCSGKLPEYRGDELAYTAVPPRIATAIIGALGQPLSTARVELGGNDG